MRQALAIVSQAAAHTSSGGGEQKDHSSTTVASVCHELLSPSLWKVPGKGKVMISELGLGRPEL